MPIERLYKPKNSFKVFRSDSYIPTGNNAVLDVICGNFLVRNGSVSVRTLKLIGLGISNTRNMAIVDMMRQILTARQAMKLLISLPLAMSERKNKSEKRALNSFFCSSVRRSVWMPCSFSISSFSCQSLPMDLKISSRSISPHANWSAHV